MRSNGDTLVLRPAHRRLLACLLLDPETWVTTDTLVDRMWGDSPPNTSRSTLHVHLSAVRRQIPEVIHTGRGGYLIALDGNEFDVLEFSSLVTDASARLEQGHFREASDLAGRALKLWRGHPYPELEDVDAARAERVRLSELSTTASATLARSLTLQGRVSESIAHLRGMVGENPLNEPIWEELIHAYYLAGRQVDALAAFNEAKTVLGDELGLEPGPRLRQMEEKVLLHDPELMGTAASVIANNLPTLDSSFIGREDDLGGVLDLLHQNHLVTITGAPGIGKTRLAIEVAARGIEGFPGGVWLGRLAGARTDADVSATIAAAIGVTDNIESLDRLYQHLASQPALLILDNCEHLLPSVRQFLSSRAHGGMLRVLATSRNRLGVADEVVWPLRMLELPEDSNEMWESSAMRLLVDRVGAADPTMSLEALNQEELLEVCRKTGGLPLALELAARWIPSLDLASVNALTLKPVPGQADTYPEHHASLSAAFGWSLALLDDSDGGLFDAASCFASSFTATAFSRVCNPKASSEETSEVIARLVEASLLIPERPDGGEVRYRVLEPLREFGSARLRSARRSRAILDRHAAWFVGAARQVASAALSSAEASTTGRVDLEIADYRLAMRRLIDRGRANEAVEIAIDLVHFWIARFLGWEGQRWLDECLELDLEGEHRLRALSAAGQVAFYIGEYDRSAVCYEKIGELAALSDDRHRKAEALYGVGRVEIHGRPSKGRALLARAIPLFEECGDVIHAAECRLILGIQAAYAADRATALPILTAATDALEEVGYPKFEAVGHRYLSMVAWYDDDESQARHHVEVAEQKAEESGDRRVLSGVLAQRALVEGSWGDPGKAASALIESLNYISDQHGIYFCLNAFGAIPMLIEKEHWSLAGRLLSHFDRIYDKFGWIPIDRRIAAAAGYRAQVTAGMAKTGAKPDQSPVSTPVIAVELIEALTNLVDHEPPSMAVSA